MAMELVDATGFDAYDSGLLSEAWRFQRGNPAFCADLDNDQLRLALSQADRALAPRRRDLGIEAIYSLGDYDNTDVLHLYRALTKSSESGADMTTPPRLPFDPGLEAVLEALKDVLPGIITPDRIDFLKGQTTMEGVPTPDQILGQHGLVREDHTVAGQDGATIEVSVVRKPSHSGQGPGILHAHGGGMVAGDRWTGMNEVSSWVADHDAVAVTVEYRLAPEFPDPYPIEDCYAGLVWTADHAEDIGIDPDRLLIAGSSAGGGLAAGTALLARDRKGPRLIGQMLIYPMLDDRLDSVSNLQVDGIGIWDRTSNHTGWTALLGDRRGTDEVSIYAAPSRATDLSGLPPTFIDCGSVEVFRDEDVAFASALWAAGVQTELHVWPGAFHGFEQIAPDLPMAQAAYERRRAWLSRLLKA